MRHTTIQREKKLRCLKIVVRLESLEEEMKKV